MNPAFPRASDPSVRTCFAAVFALVASVCAFGDSPLPTAPGQHPQHFEVTLQRQASLRYLLFLPQGYQPPSQTNHRWPLLLFLHGAGERGNDLAQVTRHGPPKQVLSQPDFPFVVVSPQCPAGERWDIPTLDALLSQLLQTLAVDPRRVVLTGLSMGGYGSWAWASAHPERFAAIVPICGGGDPLSVWLSPPERRQALEKLPVWAFHGGRDTVVLPAESERMLDAYRRIGNQPRYTVYPEAGHDSWTEAYNDPALIAWLLQQRRP